MPEVTFLSDHDLRHLIEYLNEPRESGGSAPRTILAVGAGLALAALLWVLLAKIGCFVFVGIFGFGGLWPAVAAAFRRSSQRKAWRRAGLSEPALEAADVLRRFAAEGKLGRRIHPEIGRLLDDCGAEALAIRRTFLRPEWRSRGGHWRDLRRTALRGVDETMHEAVLQAMPYVRRPGAKRADFERAVADDPGGARAAPALEAFRAKLRELARQLPQGESDEPAIDRALRDLRAIRGAEQELDA